MTNAINYIYLYGSIHDVENMANGSLTRLFFNTFDIEMIQIEVFVKLTSSKSELGVVRFSRLPSLFHYSNKNLKSSCLFIQ